MTAAVGRNPALRRVVLAFLLFNTVEFGTWVAILLYAYTAVGPGLIGLVALVQLVPAGAAAPFIASLADRFDRRRVLAGAYLAQAISLGAAGAGTLVAAPPIVILLFATLAAGATAATRPTQGALLPSISRTPNELTAANSVAGTMEGLGLLAGPLGAAAILALGLPGHVLVVGGVLCAVAAVLVGGVVQPDHDALPGQPVTTASPTDPMDGHESEHHGTLAGLRALRRSGDSRLIVALLALRMVTSGAMDVLFVLLALEVFRTGDSGAALLSAALGAGTVVGGAATFTLVGRQRLAPAMAVSAALVGCGLALLAATSSTLAPLLIAGAGVGYAAADVIGRIVLQRVTPDEVLARVLGALEGVGLIGLAFGSLLVPIIAGALGTQATILAVAGLLPASVALAWVGLTRIDRETKVPVRTLRLLQAAQVFAPLPPPQLEWVAKRARWLTAEPGDVVIREGDVGDAYYVLERGRLRVTQHHVELRSVTSHGDGFGEIALLKNVRRTATITAVEPSVLVAIERADFLEVLTGHEQSRGAAERAADERRVLPQDR